MDIHRLFEPITDSDLISLVVPKKNQVEMLNQIVSEDNF